MTTELKNRSSEKGFTLVELAIVMIIIGLLIGGILKGQELIANAALTSTVTQIKSIDAATSAFKDKYNSFPGDMTNPTARIPACAAAPCSNAGNGNGRLETVPDSAQAGEENAFWAQLTAADVLSSSGTNLAAEIDGNFFTGGYSTGAVGDFSLADQTVTYRGGHYLGLGASATGDYTAAGQEGLTPNEAARIDTKIDDGSPNTGSVRGMGNAGAAVTDCRDADGAAGVYSEANTGDNCGVFIRFQQ